jgi:hypothetical protein
VKAMMSPNPIGEFSSPLPAVHFLPRSGKRPLTVSGDILVEGSQSTDDNSIQYDIAVFENGDAGFAASLTCSYAAPGEMPRRYAENCEHVDDAIRFFDNYQPIDDVCVTPEYLEPSQCAEVKTLQGDILKANTAYRQLLTRLFPSVSDHHDAEEDEPCLV